MSLAYTQIFLFLRQSTKQSNYTIKAALKKYMYLYLYININIYVYIQTKKFPKYPKTKTEISLVV